MNAFFPPLKVEFTFLGLISQYLFPVVIKRNLTGIDIPIPESFVSSFEHESHASLALSQSFFSPFTLGDVTGYSDTTCYNAFAITLRNQGSKPLRFLSLIQDVFFICLCFPLIHNFNIFLHDYPCFLWRE